MVVWGSRNALFGLVSMTRTQSFMTVFRVQNVVIFGHTGDLKVWNEHGIFFREVQRCEFCCFRGVETWV